MKLVFSRFIKEEEEGGSGKEGRPGRKEGEEWERGRKEGGSREVGEKVERRREAQVGRERGGVREKEWSSVWLRKE